MKGIRPYILLFFLTMALPVFAHAQVVINEIMYNPAGSDSGREWVELYNAGASDVTVVGGTVHGSWRIADSSNHTLTDPSGGVGRGSLIIPAGGYLIVASDPTEFISGEYAGGLYSVVKSSIALNNTGSTVSLIDGTGTTIDSVSYTNTQGASDDGSSLQRQSDGSWIAALPTPGASNSLSAYAAPTDTSSQSDTSNSTSSTQTQTQSVPSVSSYVAPPTPLLYANAGADRSVIVGADTEFDASAYDKNQQSLDTDTVRFIWNFGDGETAEGAAVLHHYDYPGKYALILNIAQNKNAATDEAVVTAEPAKLSFEVLADGGVEIDNLAGRDLDLSDWKVHAAPGVFAQLFALPAHSLILSGSSMHISRATLGFLAGAQSELDYPNGVTALFAGQTETPTVAPQAPAPAPEPSPSTPISKKQSVQTISASAEIPVADAASDVQIASDTATDETAATAQAPAAGFSPWWLAAIALAGVAVIALIVAKKLGKKEWDITEEK